MNLFAWWIGGHGVFFLILFSDFLLKSYINKQGNIGGGRKLLWHKCFEYNFFFHYDSISDKKWC